MIKLLQILIHLSSIILLAVVIYFLIRIFPLVIKILENHSRTKGKE